MKPLTKSVLTGISMTVLCAFAGALLAGWLGMLGGVAVCLAVWLASQLYYISKLANWLDFPKTTKIPYTNGLWGEIFEAILKQARSRKKRKQKLTQALQRFNYAAEAMPNGVLLIDMQGRINWMNQLAAEHLNLDRDSDWGSILQEVVAEPSFHQFVQAPFGEQDTRQMKLTLPRKTVGERSLQVLRTPFTPREQLLITLDISESEQVNAMRTAFVANVSHELRTPLTVINGFLETLAETPDLPVSQSQHFIGLMQKEGKRMEMLLGDLLTLSRLESGVKAESQAIDLSDLAEGLWEDAMNLSDGKHTILREIEPDLWTEGIYTDLYNGLSNIVFNAVRYTPEGGQIVISLHPVTDGAAYSLPPIRFAVQDNGHGIAAEHIPHLTDRFYRVDKGRSRQSGGTGLGLAITKHALAEHDAWLKIDSIEGQGSTFSTLLKQCTPPDDALSDDWALIDKTSEASLHEQSVLPL